MGVAASLEVRVGALCFSRGKLDVSPAAGIVAPMAFSPGHFGPAIVAFLIETPKRLKIAVTYCKQKRAMHSNRDNFAPLSGGPRTKTGGDCAGLPTVVKSCVCSGTPIRPMRFACIEKR